MGKRQPAGDNVRGRAFFVDIDGTLERKLLGFELPVKASVEGIRELKRRGAIVFLWSVGGADHARTAARNAGIEALCDGFLPKPHVYVDDKSVSRWEDCERWKPSRLRKL